MKESERQITNLKPPQKYTHPANEKEKKDGCERANERPRARESMRHINIHTITRFECGIHFLRLTIDLIALNIFGLVWVNEKQKESSYRYFLLL